MNTMEIILIDIKQNNYGKYKFTVNESLQEIVESYSVNRIKRHFQCLRNQGRFNQSIFDLTIPLAANLCSQNYIIVTADEGRIIKSHSSKNDPKTVDILKDAIFRHSGSHFDIYKPQIPLDQTSDDEEEQDDDVDSNNEASTSKTDDDKKEASTCQEKNKCVNETENEDESDNENQHDVDDAENASEIDKEKKIEDSSDNENENENSNQNDSESESEFTSRSAQSTPYKQKKGFAANKVSQNGSSSDESESESPLKPIKLSEKYPQQGRMQIHISKPQTSKPFRISASTTRSNSRLKRKAPTSLKVPKTRASKRLKKSNKK